VKDHTTETPPDWVLLEAAKQSGYGEIFCEPKWLRYNYNVLAKSFHALCDMIAKYEKPPVDRKLLCAREAWDQWASKEYDGREYAITVRAIELWEEGFGK
jgi:hypothetical protein